MKTKGITVWEKHAEKLVVGFAAAAALVLAAHQFIGEPNAVDAPGGVRVAPDRVDALLREEALRYESRLDESAKAEAKLGAPVLAHELVRTALGGPVVPSSTLELPGYAHGPTPEAIETGDVEFAVPSIPPPFAVVAHAFVDALTEGAIERNPDVASLFGPNGPYDINFVTVRARVDLREVRRQLAGEGSGLEPVPSTWYHGHPTFPDVVIERQELVGGRWINDADLEPIPGQTTFRPRLQSGIDAIQRDEILRELLTNGIQIEVLRPPFYETLNGEPDLAVLEEGSTGGQAAGLDEATRLGDQLKRAQERQREQIERLERKYGVKHGQEEQPPPPDEEEQQEDKPGYKPPPRPGGGGRSAPGSGSEFGTGGGIAKRSTKEKSYKERRDQAEIKKLNQEIDKLGIEITELRSKLESLIGAKEVEVLTSARPWWEEDTLEVWGHDLTVEAGKTYRYAVTVRAYNPFFGRKRSLIDAQQALAEAFTLDSPRSEWSGEIEVNPFVQVFIVHAQAPGRTRAGSIDLGKADAEVWRFSNGRWWDHRFSVVPGETIGEIRRRPELKRGSEPVEIDFRTGLIVLDVLDEGEATAGALPGTLGAARSVRVLLQDLATGRILELKDPATDKNSAERHSLLSRKDQTDSGA